MKRIIQIKQIFTFLLLFTGINTMLLAQSDIANSNNLPAGATTTINPDLASAKALKFDSDGNYIFREGFCALKKNELWGFIDTTGTWVIEPQYFQWGKDIPVFSEGICLLATRAADGIGNVPIYIDKKGNQLFKNQVFAAASPFSEGVAMTGKATGPAHTILYSLINTQGVEIAGIVAPKFKGMFFEFGPFGDGLTKMWDDKSDAYGFVDNKGKWVLKPELKKWGEADKFSDERCAVQNTTNFYWGYIDKTGATKVPFDYSRKPAMFSSKRALVTNDKYQAGYLDPEGNMALDFKYTTASFDFHNGYAVVTFDNPKLSKAIIDINGKVVKELEESDRDVTVNEDGTIVYQPKTQDGLRVLNPDGSIILYDALYLDVKAFSNNRAYVEFYNDGAQSGFINRKGELVILRKD